MITRQENFNSADGELLFSVTHIYAPNGRFTRDGKGKGWHIALGTMDSVDNYEEEIIPGVEHQVPDFLPDVIIEDEPEEPIEDGGEDDGT